MRVTRVKPSKAEPKRPVTPGKAPTAPKPARVVPLAVGQRPAVKRGAAEAAPAAAAFQVDEQIGFRVRKVHQRATGIFNEIMGRFDLAPVQFTALAKLDEMGPMSQSQLERQTALDPSELLTVIGRLHRRGLIRPRPAATDPRLILLELTADAVALMAEMKTAAAKVSARILAPLTPQEAKTLAALLARLG